MPLMFKRLVGNAITDCLGRELPQTSSPLHCLLDTFLTCAHILDMCNTAHRLSPVFYLTCFDYYFFVGDNLSQNDWEVSTHSTLILFDLLATLNKYFSLQQQHFLSIQLIRSSIISALAHASICVVVRSSI